MFKTYMPAPLRFVFYVCMTLLASQLLLQVLIKCVTEK